MVSPVTSASASDYDLFVSYSRRDKAFVRELVQRLREAGYRLWVDWEAIPLLSQWREEIRQGILAADNFLYVMSPASVASVECGKEVTCAVENGKRLVPVVCQTVDDKLVNAEIASVNWVFFPAVGEEPDRFETSFAALCEALNTDLEAVRTHTRLLTKSDEWQQGRQDSSLLLRGTSLEFFERWALGLKSLSLTESQRRYLVTSRQIETQQKNRTLRQQRLALAVVSGLLLLVALFAAVAEGRRRAAVVREIDALTTASAATLAQGHPMDALMQALEAGHRQRQARWWLRRSAAPVQAALATALYQTQEYNRLAGHDNWVYGLAVHPTDGTMVSASQAGDLRFWDRSGRLQSTLDAAHDGEPINTVAYSPDGQTIASAGDGGIVKLWSAAGESLKPWRVTAKRCLAWPLAPTAVVWPPPAVMAPCGCGTWPTAPA